MGTSYEIINRSSDQVDLELYVSESSNRFDVSVQFCVKSDPPMEFFAQFAKDLTSEQLAEVGLKFLQVALYYPEGGDVDVFREWLRRRVDQVDHSLHESFVDFSRREVDGDEYAQVFALVLKFFDGDEANAKLWMETPNPLMGDTSPRDLIAVRPGKALKVVRQTLRENER